MKRLKLFLWTAVLAMAVAITQKPASAQEADTLSISGTFSMQALTGTVGDDLAEVYANGNDHGWTLTLYGVTYSYDSYFYEYYDELEGYYSYYSYDEGWITRVHATSIDFQFFGPDADVLDQVVGQQLVRGSLTDAAVLEMLIGDFYDSRDPFGPGGSYSSWTLSLAPAVGSAGVLFDCLVNGGLISDEYGYPVVIPQLFEIYSSTITDERPGNWGKLWSSDELVAIGSSEPPMPPPPPTPPPAPPTLSIADASVQEGTKGTTHLDLTVTLSRSSVTQVTVKYATSNGTASSKSDYNATSGTLTIPAGQTEGTISVSIKGDRKRELDETFYVQLSDPIGATIADGSATATILNDD